MIFKLLQENSLSQSSFKQKQEFLIKDFLPKQLITLIYADGGVGKSMLAQAISYMLSKRDIKCYTIDLDNPMGILQERKISTLLSSNFAYISRASLEISPLELLEAFNAEATGTHYKDCFFVIDSLVNFVDVHNENRVNSVFEIFKNMREAGATILILHHCNKDGKNYQGVNTIRNAIDCMYRLSKRPSAEGELNFLLEVQKERAGIKDSAFSVELDGFGLSLVDEIVARMSEYELNFTSSAKKVLKEQKRLNKTDLLSALGYEKDDRTARDCLNKFDGLLWNSQKDGRNVFYSCA